MKTLIMTLALLASSHVFANGMGDLDKIKLTPINGATLFCGNAKGAAFAVNFEAKKVWSTEPGEMTGIQLKKVKIEALRCRDCFKISGIMPLGNVQIVLKTSPGRATGTATGNDHGEVITMDLGNLICKYGLEE